MVAVGRRDRPLPRTRAPAPPLPRRTRRRTSRPPTLATAASIVGGSSEPHPDARGIGAPRQRRQRRPGIGVREKDLSERHPRRPAQTAPGAPGDTPAAQRHSPPAPPRRHRRGIPSSVAAAAGSPCRPGPVPAPAPRDSRPPPEGSRRSVPPAPQPSAAAATPPRTGRRSARPPPASPRSRLDPAAATKGQSRDGRQRPQSRSAGSGIAARGLAGRGRREPGLARNLLRDHLSKLRVSPPARTGESKSRPRMAAPGGRRDGFLRANTLGALHTPRRHPAEHGAATKPPPWSDVLSSAMRRRVRPRLEGDISWR